MSKPTSKIIQISTKKYRHRESGEIVEVNIFRDKSVNPIISIKINYPEDNYNPKHSLREKLDAIPVLQIERFRVMEKILNNEKEIIISTLEEKWFNDQYEEIKENE